jgi:tetratricopeptide (TPR) repeat protein
MPIQQEIAANVAREIGLKLRAGAASPPAAKSIPPEAYDAFLRGLYLLHSGRNDAVFESVQHFQNAVAHAPDYALAYAWLAFAYNRLSSGDHVPPKKGYALAKAAALRAIEIDPTLPEAHAALGFILRSYEWDWQGAEQELRRAVAVGPNTPVAHQVYGLYLSAVGRHEEAIAALNRAAALDPLSPVVASNRASAYGYARRFEEAKAMWQGRGDISLSRSWPHILIMNGKYREALSLLEAAPKDAQRWELVSGKAQAYAGLGRTREARAILEQLKSRPEARNILSPHIALIHAQLGETDEALRWLEMAVEEHSARLVYLKVDPGWDQLRGDPRFHALLRRMNFTDPLSAP